MRRIRTLTALALAFVVPTLFAGTASAAPATYTVHMYPNEEVPDHGPEGAHGMADLKADPDAGKLCYKLTYDGKEKPTAAHVHKGVKGKSGAPVIDLKLADNGLEGCVPAERSVLKEIIADPAGYYANIHTAAFPKGAVRGQLKSDDGGGGGGGGGGVPGPIGDLIGKLGGGGGGGHH